MTVYTLRHGETVWNAEGKLCGMIDVPLTERGRAQARNVASLIGKENETKYQIRHILSSPLVRARETAEAIGEALGLPVEVDERLHEVSFGDWEGMDWNDPRRLEVWEEPFVRYPNGESLTDAALRVYPLLDGLEERFHGENVLLVCHGALGKVIATYYHSVFLKDFGKQLMPNCTLVPFGATERKTSIPIKPFPAELA